MKWILSHTLANCRPECASTQMSRSNRRKIKIESRIITMLMSDVTPVVNWVTLKEIVPKGSIMKIEEKSTGSF